MKHFNVFLRHFILGVIALIFSQVSLQAQTTHWNVNGLSNYDTWSIYLDNIIIDNGTTIDSPDGGDELAVFSGTTLVGVYYFDGSENFIDDYQTDYEMVAFSFLDDGVGYSPGDVVTFKYWDGADETTGNFTDDDTVILDNPDDPGEYLDDGDGTLEFPAGEEPHSYVALAFDLGYSISGTISFAPGDDCFSDITDVEVEIDTDPVQTTNPNSQGGYSFTGLPQGSTIEYNISAGIDGYFPPVSTTATVSPTTQNVNDADIELEANKKDLEFTLIDDYDDTELTEAFVKLFYAGDSSLIDSKTYTSSSPFSFDTLCYGDYFIAVAKSGYLPDSTEVFTIDGSSSPITEEYRISRQPGTLVLNIDDATTGDDILGATVTSGVYSATAASGVYTLTLPWGTYDIDIEAENYPSHTVEAIELTAGDTVNRNIELAPIHFPFVGGYGITAPNWSIFITTATIDGEPLDVNDEIAIYDDGDTLVGTYLVSADFSTTDPTNRVLKAFSQLENEESLLPDEGYTGDDEYSIVVYDFSAGIEITPTSFTINQDSNGDGTNGNGGDDLEAYDADDGTFPSTDIDAPHSYLNLSYTPNEQITFNLETGYQMISSYLEISKDIEEAFDPVLDNLEVVKNEDGHSFREIGTTWANNIGAWGIEEGYLVKMAADDQLVLTGQPTLSSYIVKMYEGFNIISYLKSSAINALDVFTDGAPNLAEDAPSDDITFVRDSDGNHLWNIAGSWVNNIGDMKPGEGYFVKTVTSTTINLNYNPGSLAKSSEIAEKAEPQFFTFDGGNATDKVYTVYIESETLEAGDEVAAYNDGVMVGSTVINDPTDAYHNNLNIFETVNSGSGFEAGNEMELKVWSPRTNDVYTHPYYEFVETENAYNKSEYPVNDAQYSHIKLTVKTLSLEENELMANVKVYPNPSDNKMMVASPEDIDQVRVINTIGQTIYLKKVNTREHTINVSDFDSGVYILEITIQGYTKTTRIIVR